METMSAHPVLSCEEAREFEKILFAGDEVKEWAAMECAGAAVGRAVLRDFEEIGGFPSAGCVLVLAGKGHNGGDALLAAKEILSKNAAAKADVVLVYGEHAMRPLAMQAYRALVHAAPGRVNILSVDELPAGADLVLDGVFGFQFRPPLDQRAKAVLRHINAATVTLRAAVDLPSGLGQPDAFRADFTYATGIVKMPVIGAPETGRLRYLDLGFFGQGVAGLGLASIALAKEAEPGPGSPTPATNYVITSEVLVPLRALRPAQSDKRTYGHLFILGGSRSYPGAVLMNVMAALRSGAGLVTAFVPESLAPAFAAHVPEAMWVGWPETPDGGLALEGLHLLRARLDRATALAMGSGMGTEAETLALAADVAKLVQVPMLVDADALRPLIVEARGGRPMICTPHAGEYARLADGRELREYCHATKATVVLKGSVTKISDGQAVYHSFFGGPVLARGGSGDVLAGLIGGLLAQKPKELLWAAAAGTVWHGRAADALSRSNGQVAVHTTQLLDYLSLALRQDTVAGLVEPGPGSATPATTRQGGK